MKYKPKKWMWIVGIILLLFIITNPSMKRFKDYRGESSYRGLYRTHNFIVFSIYQDGQKRYLGLMLNFFQAGYGDYMSSSSYGKKPHKPTKGRDYEED